jgi:hypothetical protein
MTMTAPQNIAAVLEILQASQPSRKPGKWPLCHSLCLMHCSMFAGLFEGKTGTNESNRKLFSQTVSASKRDL